MADAMTPREAMWQVLDGLDNAWRKATVDPAQSAINKLERLGYVLAPVEPTDAMIDAGWYESDTYGIYRAMLAARPKG